MGGLLAEAAKLGRSVGSSGSHDSGRDAEASSATESEALTANDPEIAPGSSFILSFLHVHSYNVFNGKINACM